MADTMNFGPEWLRTLSSGNGSSTNQGPPSPTKLPSGNTPTTPLGKRLQFKLAEFRYGKEELLQMCSEELDLPDDLPTLSTAYRPQFLTPLAFMPLSEEEQMALSGRVNSDTVYGMRTGRGYYPNRGGRGRGRGRGDYHRSTSYPDDQSANFYGNRTAGVMESWPAEGRGGGYTPTSGRGRSRASQDGNWRSQTTPQEEEPPSAPNWGNHWHPPPSPGKQPSSPWKDKEQSGGSEKKWQALPEWASDDAVTSSSVGSFDSSGNFTTQKDGKQSMPPDDTSPGQSDIPSSESEPPEPKLQLKNPPKSRSSVEKDAHVSKSARTTKSYSSVAQKSEDPPPPGPSNPHIIREEFKRKVMETMDTAQLSANNVQPAVSVSQTSSGNNSLAQNRDVDTGALSPTGHKQTTLADSLRANSFGSSVGESGSSSGLSGSGRDHMKSGDLLEEAVMSPSSVDDEHMKQIEKAAEALLSTEEEETPTPSPTSHNRVTSSESSHPSTTSTATHPHSLHMAPSTTTAQPPLVNPEDLNKWLYQDPQGEIQGPFSSADMKKWFDAGYFTMELMVRRACDIVLLPLGQVIRVWGRTPFSQSGQVPPPVRPEEPYWQAIFKQPHQLLAQQQLMLQQVMKVQQNTPAPPDQAHANVPTQQSQSSHVGHVTQPPPPSTTSSESLSIWGNPKTKESNEDQWPDITSSEGMVWDTPTPSGHAQKESVANKIKPEVGDKEHQLQEQARRLAAAAALEKEKARQREEQRKLAEIEERKRQEEEERRRAEEKRKRQLAEDARRLEAEAKARLELQKRAEEERLMKQREEQERQRRLEEARILQKQREERERQMLEQEKLERESQQAIIQQQHAAWLQQQQQVNTLIPAPQPVRQSGPSLLQIQQEEEVQAAEQRQREELMRAQLHQQQMRHIQQQTGWNSSGVTSVPIGRGRGISSKAVSKPKSFLEIQQEQESDSFKRTAISTVASSFSSAKAPPKSKGTWSSITKTNKQPQAASSSWPNPQSHPHPTTSSRKEKAPSFGDNEDDEDDDDDGELSFWEECAIVAKKNPAPTPGGMSGHRGSQKKKNVDKEEENLRRLLSANDASSEFNSWCEIELRKFNTDVDAATFVSFLLEVDSVYEVHDYIKSYLGETKDAHDFAKQFLDRRQKVRPMSQQQQQQQHPPTQSKKTKSRDRTSSHSGDDSMTRTPSNSGPSGGVGLTNRSGDLEDSGNCTGNSKSRQKKKKKMQKVNPASLLGFTVNAADRPNMGEIQSVRDTL